MEKITSRNKWTYSIGCIGRDMMFVLVSMFILAYIQYTMNLSVAQFSAISMVMIFARIWDAVNDPMMGIIIENSRFKSGKFRPWILIGGVSNFVVTLLLFLIRPNGWGFVAFFAVAYIAWGMTFTMNDISYWSLLPNLSKDNKERNNLSNLVALFAAVGQFLAGGLIPGLVTGNAVMMYKVVGVVISFAFLGFTLFTYFGVREPKREVDKGGKVGLKKMIRIITKNDQLVVMTFVILLHTIASELFVALGLNFFYFEFGYGGIQLTIFTVFFGLGTLTANAVFPVLSKKHSRLSIMTFATSVSVIGYLIFLSLGYLFPMNEIVLYIAAFMIFFGQGMFFIIMVVMTANTIEYNEVLTGERNESIVFSVRPFMTKLAAAIQQGIVSLVLILSGVFVYSGQVADLEIEKAKGLVTDITMEANTILAAATPSMKLMLRIGMGLIPMLCLILAFVLIKRKYIINEEKYDQMLEQLANR
jgi:melibiose permease/lactose/raffinose/galactose permease